MFIPGRESLDPKDLALQAEVSASSVISSAAQNAFGELNLAEGGFAVFPARKGRVVIWFRSSEPATVVCHLHTDMLPNRYLTQPCEVSFQWKLEKGISFQELEVPKQAWGRFAMLTFKPVKEVSLQCCEKGRTGFLCGTEDSSDYQEPLLRYLDGEEKQIYSASHVNDGYDRPWGEPHEWIASEEDVSPWLQLAWKQPVKLGEIRVYLEPDLSMELVNSRAHHWALNHHYTRREGMPPQLLRRFTVAAYSESGTRTVLAEVENNACRMAVIPVSMQEGITRIRLEEMETWGHQSPAVYEIRAYESSSVE